MLPILKNNNKTPQNLIILIEKIFILVLDYWKWHRSEAFKLRDVFVTIALKMVDTRANGILDNIYFFKKVNCSCF